MKQKPILFSTPMVQAILDGRKTMTRRIVKPQTAKEWFEAGVYPDGKPITPKYIIGDILWVRETFAMSYDTEDHPELMSQQQEKLDTGWVYKADGKPFYFIDKWKPSIFMPREACRIFLKVTKVRVERLHDISEEDAIAEGIELISHNCFKNYMQGKDWFYNKMNQNGYEMLEDPIGSFSSLWQSINGKESWNLNPYVWVYEFKQIEKP